MNNLQSVRELLSDKSKKILIVSHVNPDGDAIGSCMGLYHYLKNSGFENINVISPNAFPSFLEWIPESEKIIIAQNQTKLSGKIIKEADLIFCLDFNDIARTEDIASRLKKTVAPKILIDHHPDPKPHFDFVYSDVESSSTAEMIYEFIHSLEGNNAINKTIAECLYAGIITDTGSLSYGCNNPRTYHILAHLMETGINGEKIHRLIYDTYSEERMRLLGHCLSQRLRVLPEYQTAFIFLTSDDLKKFNYKDGDTEGVVNYGLSIKGIFLAAIFIERKENIKISFRSEGNLNVNILARKYFNGGGHKNAAGGNYKDSMEGTINYFESVLKIVSKDNFKALQGLEYNS